MAKDKPTEPVARTSKPKTPKQIEKRELNKWRAENRLRDLQQRQDLANELRAKGYFGSDDAIIRKAAEDQQNRQAEERIKQAEEYVANVLAIPEAGNLIRRWLNERITMAPLHVEALIKQFFSRPRNRTTKEYCDEFLSTEEGRKIIAGRRQAA